MPRWNLDRIGAGEALDRIAELKARGEIKGDNVLVAVIDTGVDYDHLELRQSIWRNPHAAGAGSRVGRDDDETGIAGDLSGAPFTGDFDPLDPAFVDPMDDSSNGHGTHVAAIIAGTGQHGGVAVGNAKIMALKVLPKAGRMRDVAATNAAIVHAVAMGAKVINLSWGGSSKHINLPLGECIAYMRDHHKDVVFVVAAGNRNIDISQPETPHYPATFSLENMIVVAATGNAMPERFYAEGSNFSEDLVHLAAPGGPIKGPNSRLADFPAQPTPIHASSAAAPHVSGAAALLKLMHPHWHYTEIKAHLMASVDELQDLVGKVKSRGRLNARRAVEGPLAGASSEGGTNWRMGAPREIRWDVSYLTPVCKVVNLKWSSDDGATFHPQPLAANIPIETAGAHRAMIEVPPVATTTGLVRVECPGTLFSTDLRGISTLR